MCIQNRLASLTYKLTLVVISGFALFLQSGLSAGRFTPYMFVYYPVQTTLFCFLYCVYAAIACGVDMYRNGTAGFRPLASGFKGAVTMAGTITMFLYFFQLASPSLQAPGPLSRLGNLLMYLVVPLMMILDYALFDRKGRYQAVDPMIWLVYPIFYFLFSIVGALLEFTYPGNLRYPHTFINPDLIGWQRVFLHVLVSVAGFLALGYIVFAVDRLLGNALEKRLAEQAAAAPPLPQSTGAPAGGPQAEQAANSAQAAVNGGHPTAVPGGPPAAENAQAAPAAAQGGAPGAAAPAQSIPIPAEGAPGTQPPPVQPAAPPREKAPAATAAPTASPANRAGTSPSPGGPPPPVSP